MLSKAFGNTTNAKGFKMLPPYLRVIQGDGISYKTIGMLLNFVINSCESNYSWLKMHTHHIMLSEDMKETQRQNVMTI